MKKIVYSLALLSCVSCSWMSSGEPYRPLTDSLSQFYAETRAKHIDQVNYHLQFDLTQKNHFTGEVQVEFQLSSQFPMSLDFVAGEVQRLVVNGTPVFPVNYNGFYIDVPESLQKKGANRIDIEFSHAYTNNGTGLYRSVDPLDDRVYIYSMFEPYNANKMFPCFDQPDLKATYTTQVIAPKDWHVITSNREAERVDQAKTSHWSFPKSARFSTYTYSLHAGEYQVFQADYHRKKNVIPMRLFVRRSLAPFVDPDEWFSLTRSGFDFFEKYFSTAYPYEKYDQLIVPDFNHGAMENVGAVTFSETRFVSKGKKTRDQKRRLAMTLFHEMAHMWFGNLVTMKWWDDLWLNESFATYASFLGVVHATEFNESWATFNRWAKQPALSLDQSINTHPIMMDVVDTSQAFASFDSITYGKGASTLKQLSFLVGESHFKKALASYFKKFAHQNATSQDFISTIQKQSKVDLTDWSHRWLKTPSVNEIEVNYSCKKGRISNFEIYQTASQKHPFLRTHKTRLALYRRSGDSYKINSKVNVKYQGGRTFVKKMIGKLCPHIVYPNYQDHDYVKIDIDSKSLKRISSSLALLQDQNVRGQVWSDLWNMVKDQKIDADRFLEIVEFNGLNETDLVTVGKIGDYVKRVLDLYYPRQGLPWAEKREIWIKFFEQSYLTRLKPEKGLSVELAQLWFKNLLSIAESEEVLDLLAKALKEGESAFGLNFPFTQDVRWQMLSRLMEFDHQKAQALLDAEMKRDPSKRGQREALFVQALRPDLESKEKYFKQLVDRDPKQKLGELRYLLGGLFPRSQVALQKSFIDRIYDGVEKVATSADAYFARSYVRALVPQFCDKKSSTRIQNFMTAKADLPFLVSKVLKDILYENDQCYKVRKRLKSQLPRPRSQQI